MGEQATLVYATPPPKRDRVCTISPCGLYRYELGEVFDVGEPVTVWCMCNPSTADAEQDDQTVRKVRGFSKGSWVIVNPYAFRSTKPRGLLAVQDPTGPDNVEYMRKWFRRAERIIVGWGGALPKQLRGHASATVRLLAGQAGHDLWCYGRTKDGQPQHPLTLAYSTPLERWP